MDIFEFQSFAQKEFLNQVLEETEITECHFSHCTFFGNTLVGCIITNCTFENCTIADTTTNFTTLMNNSFKDCKIIGIDWADLKAKGAVLPFSKTEHCAFIYNRFHKLQLKGFSFEETILEGCFFDECDLSEASFYQCDLSDTQFRNNNLTKADFRHAVNYAINIQENKMKASRFSFPDAVNLLTASGIKIDDL